MRVDFKDEDLRRLYSDPGFHHPRFGSDVTQQFRRKMAILVNAADSRDLYAMKGLRFEKLRGQREGQCSIRLNEQWRLILELEGESAEVTVRILEVVDYH